MKKVLSLLLFCFILISSFSGCGLNRSSDAENDTTKSDSEAITESINFTSNADMFTERDSKTDYNESDAVKITLSGKSASATSDSVEISGSTVTIKE